MYTNCVTTFGHTQQFLEQVSEFIVIKRLDACKPLAFSFYLEFSSHEGAQAVTDWLMDEGFSVVMEQEYESNKWLCWCHCTSIPKPLKLEEMGGKILDAVKTWSGTLKRWETNPYNSGQELGQLLAAFELQYMQEHGHYA
ncbi:hypothetical protein [Alteromonas sp. a30]|uniref:hypothetical protein n=1 Tax=Alteromonas sp. a30 TaxID=2730917 RepID=UPI00228082C4|nr:hypothetical protein [Alteromonas sp. a30]MCY7296283.1 hypothetical protein [Alteromonas sp. a30]